MPAHRDPSWHIKSMPPAERQAATQAAQRQDMAIGEWLASAVRAKLQIEAGALAPSTGMVLPPDAPGAPPVAPADLEPVARSVAALAGAGVPLPKTVTDMLWKRMREAMGAKPRKRGAPKVAPGAPLVLPPQSVSTGTAGPSSS